MINKVKNLVNELVKNDNSGHGMDHIMRVYHLALKIANNYNVDRTLVSLIALLHDVDDYKLYNHQTLINATKIMEESQIDLNMQKIVLVEIAQIGYHNRLLGKMPKTMEGQIVSDADMCDALGAEGILRTYAYSLSIKRPFFANEIFPNLDADYHALSSYTQTTGIGHFFEKLLRLPNLMFTKDGKAEALKRQQFMITFLYQFFNEENATDWTIYLDNYLKKFN